jgi:regulator of protease activity HflC (stomatin/prohibitin superfamily)
MLPEETTKAVFERMGASRDRLAAEIEAKGQAVAQAIRDTAENEARMIRAFADSRAQEIRKQGDREAATYLGQMNSNPELAVFLRRMEFLRDATAKRMTFVFPTSMPGFDLVKPDSLNGLKKGQIPAMPNLDRALSQQPAQADGGRPVSDQGQPLPERGPGEPQASPRLTRRAKSITLRQGSEMESPGALMDAAHKSLADALRITFGLVQIGMVVLAALYVLSGFQSVKQNEQGIRLLFGKIDADGLEPGFQFSLPAPLGEMVKVSTGAESVDLDSEFWVRVSPADKEKPIDSLPKLPKLNPENEGAVLTGDGNVAHTQWKASYRRVKPGEYATSIMPTDEAAIVRAAVQRGVVQAVSQTSIEDLLKQSASERASVAANARDVAQAILDRARSGIVIEQLILKDKMPPLYVRDSFAKVQTAASNAGTEQDKARSEREQKLNKVAGAAAPGPPRAHPPVRTADREERPARGRESARHHLQAARRRARRGRRRRDRVRRRVRRGRVDSRPGPPLSQRNRQPAPEPAHQLPGEARAIQIQPAGDGEPRMAGGDHRHVRARERATHGLAPRHANQQLTKIFKDFWMRDPPARSTRSRSRSARARSSACSGPTARARARRSR